MAASLRVLLVAEEAAGVQALRELQNLRPAVEIVAVLTRSAADGAGRPVVHEAARALGLDVWPASSVKSPELATRIQSARIDLLLNVHSLYRIHAAVIAAPTIGCFNLHPGPLPEYAGLNVPSWAIYAGESSHGVTLHWMDADIDTGPIVWQERFGIEPGDTGLAVAGKCVRGGIPLIVKLVRLAAENAAAIPRQPQDLTRRTSFPAGPPADGRLSWSQPADAILRFVRAADYAPFRSPWGHPVAELGGLNVGIAKAAATGTSARSAAGTLIELTEAGALVTAADELVLVRRVWVDGRYLKPSQLPGV